MQICIDCVDPHAQVAFWSAAFGYEPERDDGLIQRLLDTGQITEDEVIEVDGRPAFRVAAACRHPRYPRLLFQVVPEAKAGKNRVYLDFHVEDRAATVERLLGLGATRLWDGEQGPTRWVTMADPEGNEFCVAGPA